MSTSGYQLRDLNDENDELFRAESDDRHGLLGLMALLGLAIPALLIRSLFPDLSPVFLAGLGVAVYCAYLGLMGATLLRQAGQKQVEVAPARVTPGEK